MIKTKNRCFDSGLQDSAPVRSTDHEWGFLMMEPDFIRRCYLALVLHASAWMKRSSTHHRKTALRTFGYSPHINERITSLSISTWDGERDVSLFYFLSRP
jgi:hypothetical protein